MSESFEPHLNQLILECHLNVQSSSPETSANIVWLKNGYRLSPTGDRKYSMIRHENGTQQLLISRPTQSDSAHYSCRLETSSGDLLDEVSRVVNFVGASTNGEVEKVPERRRRKTDKRVDNGLKQPIAFESFLKNSTVEEGQRAKFICTVRGPVDCVTWLRDNHPLANDLRYQISKDDGLISLEICDVELSDAGFYSCTAAGPRNEITTSSRLSIYASPNRRASLVPSQLSSEPWHRPPVVPITITKFKGKVLHEFQTEIE